MTTSNPASRAIWAASSLTIPSCIQRTFAPMAARYARYRELLGTSKNVDDCNRPRYLLASNPHLAENRLAGVARVHRMTSYPSTACRSRQSDWDASGRPTSPTIAMRRFSCRMRNRSQAPLVARTVASGERGRHRKEKSCNAPTERSNPLLSWAIPLLHLSPVAAPGRGPSRCRRRLQPHRDAHQIRSDPRCCLLLVRQLRCVVLPGWMISVLSPILARCETSATPR